jgi:PAT family beta-lactamase induction signal transducer AmpG
LEQTEWQIPPPDEAKISPIEGDTYFVVTNTEINLGLNKLSSDQASNLKNWTHDSNIKNRFLLKERSIEKSSSWWSSNVSGPLKEKLKKSFGNDEIEKNQGSSQGNLAVIGIRLSSPPEADETVVLNLDRKTGDKNLSLVNGQRLTFTRQNWNKQAWVLIQADPKLETIVTTSFEGLSGNIPLAWSVTLFVLAGLFVFFVVYHRFALPKPATDVAITEGKGIIKEFLNTFSSFFKKKNIGVAIAFLLLFRLGESQLVKLASPFLLETREAGGLGLTTGDIGLIYGTIGIIFLTLGGILGGWAASRNGLKYWLLWMTLAINLPNLTYVYLSMYTPESLWLTSIGIAVEQFGYGFGFTAYMLYMIYISEGKSKTAHYAICTGLMALGMMIPGMVSGWLQEIVGYQNFFIWVMICTIPSFVVIRYLKVDSLFGIKKQE